MARTEILTLQFTMEIHDVAALQQFTVAKTPWGAPDPEGVPPGELVARAAAHVLADAFTVLKAETGIALRSVRVIGQGA